jgi:hypothetical protein
LCACVNLKHARSELRDNHEKRAWKMEKQKPEYPTDSQIKETLDAHVKGDEALMELILKRRAQQQEKPEKTS